MSRVPFYLQHIYHPAIYLSLYVAFNIIYVKCGGTDPWGDHYIYEPLDYLANPLQATMMCILLAVVVLPILEMILWRWWWWCERKWGEKATQEPQKPQQQMEEGVTTNHYDDGDDDLEGMDETLDVTQPQ